MRFGTNAEREFYFAQYHVWGALQELKYELNRAENLALRYLPQYKSKLDMLVLRRDAAVSRLHNAAAHMEALYGKANFNPAQPRVPKGNSDGGRWTDIGGNDGSSSRAPIPQPRPEGIGVPQPEEGLRSVYPLETVILAAGSIAALPARAVIGVVQALSGKIVSDVSSRLAISKAARSIEQYLGGKGRVIEKNGNYTFIRGDKQIRFDFGSRHGPHFHLQRLIKGKSGKVITQDAIVKKHRFPFKI